MDDLLYNKYMFVFDIYKNRYKTEDPLSYILYLIINIENEIEINNKNKEELIILKKDLEFHRDILVK